MKVYVTKNYEDLSKKAATIILSQVVLNPYSVLGLATGSTPIGTYKYLVEFYKNKEIDFSNVISINLDEYKGIASENNQSYRYFMDNHLFKHINIKMENTYIPDGLASDDDKECKRYNDLITSLGGIDLQLLGIGVNGHIGFNEPSEYLEKYVHCVALSQSTIDVNSRFFNNIDEVPKYAYSMGVKNIMSSNKILLLVSGKSKAKALYDCLYGPITTMNPSSILQLHKDLTIVSDEDAFSVIKQKV